MPSKFALMSVLTTVLGLVFGYTAMNFATSRSPDDIQRTIASSPILKIGADQISRDYYDISISPEFVAEKNNEASVIKVIVSAKRNLPAGLQFKWQLHKDMSSTDELVGALDTMSTGEKKEFILKVVGFSKEANTHVSFIILGQIGNHNLRRSVIVSSRPEDSFEYIVQQSALSEQKTGKIQKLSNGKSARKKFDPKNIMK